MQQQAISCVIPPGVWQDHELSVAERALAGRIHALSAKHGYCWAKNSYLADDLGVSKRTIRNYLSTLETRGHVTIEHVDGERYLIPRQPEKHETAMRKLASGAEKDSGPPEKISGPRARGTAGTSVSNRDREEGKKSAPAREDEREENGGQQQERAPEQVPPETEELAFKTYQHVPTCLAQWYELYPGPWIPLAIKETMDRNVTSPAYTKKILQRWFEEGGPDADSSGKNGPRDPKEVPEGEEYPRSEWEQLTADQRQWVNQNKPSVNPYMPK